MSKKMLKRSLALGALMAFIITGSAWAKELSDVNVVRESDSSATGNLIGVYAPDFSEALEFNGESLSIIVDNKTSSGSTYAYYDTVSTYENIIGEKGTTNNIIFDARGVGEVRTVNLDADYQDGSSLNIYADTVTINAHSENDMARGINVRAGADLLIDANKTIINVSSGVEGATLGIGTFTAGTVTVKGDLEINAGSGYAIAVSGGSAVKINESGSDTVKINGLVSFHKTGSTEVDSELILNLSGSDSYFNGNIIAEDDRYEDVTSKVSGMTLSIAEGATWNTDKASFVNNLVMDGGVINTSAGVESAIVIGTFEGEGTINVSSNVKGQIELTEKSDESILTIAKAINNIDALNDDALRKELTGLEGVAVFDTGAEAADKVSLLGDSAIYDEISAVVTDSGIGELNKTVASANISVNDMAAIGLMSWRAEMNDMNKRMGELRNANGEHGVWVRMVRGESEYNSVKNQYNQYQLGYDEKLSTDPSWTVGVALSYTDAENNFAQGSGESTNKALSIYGSKLNDDGTFVDLIAKYARLENDFETFSGMGAADYDANGYSFSAEFGKRIQQGKGLWIEPQVELTYGRVDSVDYVSENGVSVAQDSMDSLVGRIGFSLGKDIEKGNVYARASYLYDFDGETKATLNNDAVLKNDLGGGWWEVGVGANINLSKATYIYADVEKTFGGEADTNWQWNLGVRYSF